MAAPTQADIDRLQGQIDELNGRLKEMDDKLKSVDKSASSISKKIGDSKNFLVDAVKSVQQINKDFLEFVKIHPKEEFKREILHICVSKIDLTYWETHYLFVNKVLFNPLSHNSNILGKFYIGKIGE